MQKLRFSFIYLFIFAFLIGHAQDTVVKKAPERKSTTQQVAIKRNSVSILDSSSIDRQFDFILANSNNFQEYKVVHKVYLDHLRKNVLDSLSQVRNQLVTMKSNISGHNEQLTSLKDSLTQAQADLKTTREHQESFQIFGFFFSKGTYNILMFGIILVLLVTLIVSSYNSRKKQSTTAEAKQSLEELRAEFDQHRKRAMEREQKLNRQLQDELNKRL